jgi:hypothetical protein
VLGLVQSYCQTTGRILRDMSGYTAPRSSLFLHDDLDLTALVKEMYGDIGSLDGDVIVIKLHRASTAYVASLIESGLIYAVSTYRDPRDVALSLVDAARIDAARGKSRFTQYASLADTIDTVDYQVECLKSWALIKNVELLSFDEVSSDPQKISKKIAGRLNIPYNPEIVNDLIKQKSLIWEYNKGVTDRWVSEFGPDDKAHWEGRASSFYNFINGMLRGVGL